MLIEYNKKMKDIINFFLLFVSFLFVKDIDIKLSLGKILSSGNYPLVVVLKEPLIDESPPIDLICILDLSGRMLWIDLSV